MNKPHEPLPIYPSSPVFAPEVTAVQVPVQPAGNASVHGALLPGEPSYSEHFYSICPFLDWSADQVASADQVLGTEAWLAHDFHRNYLQPLDLLHSLFQLIRTETEVVMLVMDGQTLDETAEALGVSRNTVRAHLHGVFAMTGATRQAQPVKTLLNSVASLG
ncbi:helix-turn-helix transcriptional regulator [Pseudomonas sp. PDM26]|uniref:helix-turn-helix transcriptional regulator n=1 Tax=Pseudomonas sp. PDM26 TaxID=2854766 RepID=UPI002108BA63|nr:helix-turn-helix transcriptional regulator [Pseudomonas sp. PDM26]